MNQTLLLLCLTMLVLPGHIKKIVDGDTIALYSVGIPNEERVRLLGVNTPERGQPGFESAKIFTEQWVRAGNFVLTACKRDSFGRLLGTLVRGPEDLGRSLIAAGLAREDIR